jgi:hypothetical protein
MLGLVPGAGPWPQLWLPRAQQLAAPCTTCEHAKFERNHWQACQACASAGGAGTVPPLSDQVGPHKGRNTTVASPVQLSGVATGAKLVTLLHCPRLSQYDCCLPFPCIYALTMQHCQHPNTASNFSNSCLIGLSFALCLQWIAVVEVAGADMRCTRITMHGCALLTACCFT